jgi:hypothetical protein
MHTSDVGIIAGVGVHPDSRILLADIGRRQVGVIDPSGGRVVFLGRNGEGPGEFRLPVIVTATDSGRIVVFDAVLQRVQWFKESGAYVSGFKVPFAIQRPWAMVATDKLGVFISGAVAEAPGQPYLIHQFSWSGQHVRSFVPATQGFPSFAERMNGDGGPLILDRRTNTLWFSRAGPEFELSEWAVSGQAMRRITLSHSLVEKWSDRLTPRESNGNLTLSSKPLLGSFALFTVLDTLLVNVVAASDSGRLRYDVFSTRNGSYLMSWTQEPRSDGMRPIMVNGRGMVLWLAPAVSTDVLVTVPRLAAPRE